MFSWNAGEILLANHTDMTCNWLILVQLFRISCSMTHSSTFLAVIVLPQFQATELKKVSL